MFGEVEEESGGHGEVIHLHVNAMPPPIPQSMPPESPFREAILPDLPEEVASGSLRGAGGVIGFRGGIPIN